MRFDEKPKRGSLYLKKSHAELSRKASTKSSKKSSAKASKKTTSAKKLDYDEPVYQRKKPAKLPEDYDETESFAESLKTGLQNHLWVVAAVVILLIAVGFFTGTIQKVFHQVEGSETVATTEEYIYKPKNTFTQGKFDANFENTDAGVDIICETITSEDGTEKKTCRVKTDEDRKKEEEEKEREEQEKLAAEEREKEEEEDREARENKRSVAAAAAAVTPVTTDTESTSKAETPVRVIGITNTSGCPAEVVSGSIIVLKASVLPYNAANQGIIWIAKNASAVYEGLGTTATVTIGEGEKAIITAMTVDGGYTAHCSVPIVSSLTE